MASSLRPYANNRLSIFYMQSILRCVGVPRGILVALSIWS